MRIDLYCHVYNDAYMLAYWLRHYEQLVDRIFIYDAGSTDGTRELAQAHPKVKLIDWDCHEVNEQAYIDLAHSAPMQYSKGEADWFIWADADELIYHPRLLEVLADHTSKGHTVLQADEGYAMFHDGLVDTPGQIYDVVRTGSEHDIYRKAIVINPNEAQFTFSWGKHYTYPQGSTVVTPAEFVLLHYGWWGDEFAMSRYHGKLDRLSQFNKSINVGTTWTDDAIRGMVDYQRKKTRELSVFEELV